jgi:hypothetical protein
MFDFDIADSNLKKRSFAEVIGTTPVVVSHAVDPLKELDYYRYLDSLDHRVVLVTSKDNPLAHLMTETYGLAIETYTDPDQNLITHLKQQWSLEPDVSTLVRQLRFQMLCVHGKEARTWIQPSSEQWKHFLADRTAVKKFYKQFGSYGVKWIQEQDKNDHRLWNIRFGLSQTEYGQKMYTGTGNIDFFMKFYKLLPNEELEAELKQLA